METTLDPVIQSKLLDFRRRWRRLVLLRGLGYTVLALVGGLLLLALVDWQWPLEPETRGMCSVGLLIFTGIVFLFGCLRPLFKAPDLAGLAALMEKAEPGLRNDLLAAVELGNMKEGDGLDSAVFREMLQRDVAARAGKVVISQSLPVRLVRGWMTTGIILFLTLVIVAVVPASRDRLLRVAAPWLNIGSASAAHIRILVPADPANAVAPRHEMFLVEIEVRDLDLGGQNPIFEIVAPDSPPNAIRMNPSLENNATGRFVSSANMTADTMSYRFKVGRHSTQWHEVRAVDAPRVESYHKTVHAPDYPLFPGFKPAPEVVEEATGQLTVLPGSRVDMRANLNMPVAEANLRVTVGGNATDHPMTPGGDDPPHHASATFTVATNSVHRIHLLSTDGLTNRHPRAFDIRVRPDLIPGFVTNAPRGAIVMGPEDVLAMNALARDDVAIGEIRRLTRVIPKDANQTNDANATWTTTVLNVPNLPGNNATIDQPLDLLPLDVQAGDTVLTKLVAVDVAGQEQATGTLQIRIRSTVFEAARGEALPPKRKVYDAIRELTQAAGRVRSVVPPELEKLVNDGALGTLQQVADDAADELPKFRRVASSASASILLALNSARPGREGVELVTLSRVINRLENNIIPGLRLHLPKIAGETDAVRVARAKAAKQVIDPLEAFMEKTSDVNSHHLAADESAVMLDHLDHLARAQWLMNRAAEADANADPGAWKRLARRQAGALKELTTLKAMIDESTIHFPDEMAAELNATAAALDTSAEAMREALDVDPPGPGLLAPARALQREIEAAGNTLRPITRDLSDEAALAYRELNQLLGPARRSIPTLRDAIVAHDQARADQDGKNGNALRDALAQTKLAEETAEHQWDAAIGLLEDRATFEGARRDPDHNFVRDLLNTARSLKALRRSPKPLAERLPELDRKGEAINTREQGHSLNDLLAGIVRLSSDEVIHKNATDIRTLRVRDAEWLMELFRSLPKKLRTAKLRDATAEVIEKAGLSDDARAVSREMNRRKTQPGQFEVEE